MAASLVLTVGAVSGGRTFADQAKAAATLTAFHDKMALGPVDATPTQKLDAIAAYLARHIVSKVREAHVFEGRINLETEAANTYGID